MRLLVFMTILGLLSCNNQLAKVYKSGGGCNLPHRDKACSDNGWHIQNTSKNQSIEVFYERIEDGEYSHKSIELDPGEDRMVACECVIYYSRNKYMPKKETRIVINYKGEKIIE